MKIEMIRIEDLKPNPQNPRKISYEEMEKLKKSITEFGFVDPVIVNNHEGRKNIIIGGHQRVKAAEEMGMKEVPVVYVSLTENKEKALNLALNKISGEWDDQLLAEIIKELTDAQEEMDLTGFDDKEISNLLDSLIVPTEEEFDYDKTLQDAEKTTIKKGDIFQLGRHRLMCGDSTEKEQVEYLMNSKKSNMLFTDPPYNVDYGSNKKHPSHRIRSIKNDNMDSDIWTDFITKWVNSITPYVCGDVYIWGAPGPDGMIMRLLLKELGYHWSTTIIWKKNRLVLSPAKYQRFYEPCFYGWYNNNKSSYVGNKKQIELWELGEDVIYEKQGEIYIKLDSVDLDVWNFDRPNKSKEHPTMKPVELCMKAIRNSSKKDDIVLDVFGGSGSTLIASEQLNRTCYMMEIEPVYCQVIIDRFKKIKPDAEVKKIEPHNLEEIKL